MLGAGEDPDRHHARLVAGRARGGRRIRRLKFGTAVLVLPFRSPLVTAKALATLELLSAGRIFPAVGVGVRDPRELEAAGVMAGHRGAPGRTRRECSFTGSGETTR